MQIDDSHVGTPLAPYATVVDWHRTTNYAAGIGDANPRYFDDTRPGGLTAHPVFPVAVTWPVTLHIDRYLKDSSFPVELMAMQVHHTEHIALHRPLTPDAALTVSGTVAAILPHRAGTRVVIRYEAVDDRHRPVFTEHIGGLLRGVACTGKGRSLPDLPPEAEPAPADAVRWRHRVPIDPMLPYVYDGCSDIVFPIHTSPAFAAQVGLPGIILQGTATLALAVSEIVNRETGGDPSRLTALGCRFTGMVFPGSAIDITLQAREGCDLFFEVSNENGDAVVRRGYARIVE